MKASRSKQLDHQAQRTLALWAADCAERVLGLCEVRQPHDDRPRKAIEAARAWARGEINCTPARAAAVAAHAAARAATDPAAIATARLCGHTAAIAHSARHAGGVPLYTLKAVTAAAGPVAAIKELAWQKRRLPKKLWPLVFPAATNAASKKRRVKSRGLQQQAPPSAKATAMETVGWVTDPARTKWSESSGHAAGNAPEGKRSSETQQRKRFETYYPAAILSGDRGNDHEGKA